VLEQKHGPLLGRGPRSSRAPCLGLGQESRQASEAAIPGLSAGNAAGTVSGRRQRACRAGRGVRASRPGTRCCRPPWRAASPG
jgi:hypothetical protein